VSVVPTGIALDQNCGVTSVNVVPPAYFRGPTIPGSPTTAALTNVNPVGTEKLICVVVVVVAAILDWIVVVCVVPSGSTSVSHDNGRVLPTGQ
jgi:hypothetical protein